MKRKRLAFALKELSPSDWRRFETFAQEYQVVDHPNLRFVGGKNERGRDGELWAADGKPAVLLQYSVTAYWDNKIKKTAQSIRKSFPDTRVFIYNTNQEIGPEADSLKAHILDKYGLVLDIRDATWFLDRLSTSEQHEIVSEQLAAEFVDSLLPHAGATGHSSTRTLSVLSRGEQDTALVYLGLQWENASREQGLTRMAFEALVR